MRNTSFRNKDYSDVTINTNKTTWQHVQMDLAQETCTGWPYRHHEFDPHQDTLKNIYIIEGVKAMIIDDVQLTSKSPPAVPEPGSGLLFSLTGLVVLACRCRKQH